MHFCAERVGGSGLRSRVCSRLWTHLVEFLSKPMRLEAIAETTLQHAVAGNFAQVRATKPPHCACNCVLLDERLTGSGGKKCVMR